MIVRPTNVEWDVVRYNDIETPLFTTDYQKIIHPNHDSSKSKLKWMFYNLSESICIN